MKNKVLMLRISYRVGAALDAITLIPLLFPKIGGMMLGIPNFNPGVEYKYMVGIASTLMLGWTVLLLWADRKPVERRDVLLLTLIPVMLGLVSSGVYAVSSGMVNLSSMIPMWVFQSFVIILFSISYFGSGKLPENRRDYL